MATMQEDIEAGLFARANGLEALTGLPISWPNMDFQPPENGRYLGITHLPNVTERLSRVTHRYAGILQISVVVGLDGGALDATKIAGQVVGHFPTNAPLNDGGRWITIYKQPDIAPAMRDDRAWIVPVSVYYEIFA